MPKRIAFASQRDFERMARSVRAYERSSKGKEGGPSLDRVFGGRTPLKLVKLNAYLHSGGSVTTAKPAKFGTDGVPIVTDEDKDLTVYGYLMDGYAFAGEYLLATKLNGRLFCFGGHTFLSGECTGASTLDYGGDSDLDNIENVNGVPETGSQAWVNWNRYLNHWEWTGEECPA